MFDPLEYEWYLDNLYEAYKERLEELGKNNQYTDEEIEEIKEIKKNIEIIGVRNGNNIICY